MTLKHQEFFRTDSLKLESQFVCIVQASLVFQCICLFNVNEKKSKGGKTKSILVASGSLCPANHSYQQALPRLNGCVFASVTHPHLGNIHAPVPRPLSYKPSTLLSGTASFLQSLDKAPRIGDLYFFSQPIVSPKSESWNWQCLAISWFLLKSINWSDLFQCNIGQHYLLKLLNRQFPIPQPMCSEENFIGFSLDTRSANFLSFLMCHFKKTQCEALPNLTEELFQRVWPHFADASGSKEFAPRLTFAQKLH